MLSEGYWTPVSWHINTGWLTGSGSDTYHVNDQLAEINRAVDTCTMDTTCSYIHPCIQLSAWMGTRSRGCRHCNQQTDVHQIHSLITGVCHNGTYLSVVTECTVALVGPKASFSISICSSKFCMNTPVAGVLVEVAVICSLTQTVCTDQSCAWFGAAAASDGGNGVTRYDTRLQTCW